MSILSTLTQSSSLEHLKVLDHIFDAGCGDTSTILIS